MRKKLPQGLSSRFGWVVLWKLGKNAVLRSASRGNCYSEHGRGCRRIHNASCEDRAKHWVLKICVSVWMCMCDEANLTKTLNSSYSNTTLNLNVFEDETQERHTGVVVSTCASSLLYVLYRLPAFLSSGRIRKRGNPGRQPLTLRTKPENKRLLKYLGFNVFNCKQTPSVW